MNIRPVHQTKIGVGGNCFAACVASILGLELDELPALNGNNQVSELNEWLAHRGMFYLEFTFPQTLFLGLPGPTPCILTVGSSNPEVRAAEAMHAIVGCIDPTSENETVILHDPNPEANYPGGYPSPTLVGFLLRFSPSADSEKEIFNLRAQLAAAKAREDARGQYIGLQHHQQICEERDQLKAALSSSEGERDQLADELDRRDNEADVPRLIVLQAWLRNRLENPIALEQLEAEMEMHLGALDIRIDREIAFQKTPEYRALQIERANQGGSHRIQLSPRLSIFRNGAAPSAIQRATKPISLRRKQRAS